MPRDPVRDPCPGSNGGTVGAVEPFTLLCGVDLVGDDIGSVPADNITQCADACAVYQHPRCAAVAFEASQAHGTSNCYLKSAVPTPTVQTFVMDAAVAAGPTATEDCAALGPTHTAQARVLFRTYCGYDYQRDDLVQSFAADMGACMDQCVQHNTAAAAGSCLGVAYEASQLTGFQNCYLKDGNNTADLVSPAFVVDAAFIVGTAALPTTSPAGASTPSPSPSPSSSPSPSPSIAWIAGPIVGGVAGLTLLALAARWFVARSDSRAKSRSGAGRSPDTKDAAELAVPGARGGMTPELPAAEHSNAAELA